MDKTIIVGIIAAAATIIAALIGLLVKKREGSISGKQNGFQVGDINAGRDAIIAGRDINLSATDRQARAERKTDQGREKVQDWGKEMSRSNWSDQAWHNLGFALQFAHEAIEVSSDYQRAWTLLADIYHRIGQKSLAKECLKKSYKLAKPGPNFPGRFYKEVERNINTDYPFNNSGGLKRQTPPKWFEEKYKKYWDI